MRLKNKVLSVATSLALVSSLCPLSLAFAAEGEGTGVSNGTQDQLVVLESDAVTEVKGLIKALPDAMDVTSAQPVGRYDQQILEAQDALNALSAEERAEVVTALAGSQPYGRVLESALWAMAALGAVDDSTALPDGTYDGSSEPKLESVYSKGQSTSGRDRPWSVLSVTVKDGHATACITVQSSTYTYVVWGGQRYYNAAASGNCVFEGLPIDLNATQSFTGYSTSMTTEIAFQLTNSIDESYVPEDPEPGPVDPDPDDPEPGPGPVDPEPIDPEPGPGPVDPDPIDPVDPDPVPTALDAAKRLIEALPRDAYAVTSADVTKISAAQMMYDSLSEADKKALLDQYVEGSVSYARELELAVWAMKSLNPIDNSTKLAEGTYTLSDGALMSDLGLSVSKRQNNWKVAKIEVAGGKAMATLVRVGGNTPIESFYVGGVMYENVDTAGGSTVIVPIDLNSDMYFSTQAKGASEETVPLVYHLATPFDEKGAKPDPEKEPETNEDEPGGDEPSGDKPSGDKPSGDASKDDDDKPQQIPSANSGNNSGAAGTMGALGGTTKKTAATASATAAKASSEAEEKELADGGLKAEAAAAGIAEKAGGAAAGGENLSLVAGFGLLLFVAAGAGGFTVVFRKREEH